MRTALLTAAGTWTSIRQSASNLPATSGTAADGVTQCRLRPAARGGGKHASVDQSNASRCEPIKTQLELEGAGLSNDTSAASVVLTVKRHFPDDIVISGSLVLING